MTPEQEIATHMGCVSDAFKDIDNPEVSKAIWHILHRLSVAAINRTNDLKHAEMERRISANDSVLAEVNKRLKRLELKKSMTIISGGCKPDRRKKRKPALAIIDGRAA